MPGLGKDSLMVLLLFSLVEKQLMDQRFPRINCRSHTIAAKIPALVDLKPSHFVPTANSAEIFDKKYRKEKKHRCR